MMAFCFGCGLASAQEARIVVHADQVSHRVSPYLTGACIEDVNHEIYGGLYSQMIFGESFQEPPPAVPPKGFTAYGGAWQVKDDVLWADAGRRPKADCRRAAGRDGRDRRGCLPARPKGGNAGLIVKVSEPGVGADKFTGYEISLESAGRLGPGPSSPELGADPHPAVRGAAQSVGPFGGAAGGQLPRSPGRWQERPHL